MLQSAIHLVSFFPFPELFSRITKAQYRVWLCQKRMHSHLPAEIAFNLVSLQCLTELENGCCPGGGGRGETKQQGWMSSLPTSLPFGSLRKMFRKCWAVSLLSSPLCRTEGSSLATERSLDKSSVMVTRCPFLCFLTGKKEAFDSSDSRQLFKNSSMLCKSEAPGRAIWVTHRQCSFLGIQSQDFLIPPWALAQCVGPSSIPCVLHVLGNQWLTCLLKRQLCGTQRSLWLPGCVRRVDRLCNWLGPWLCTEESRTW